MSGDRSLRCEVLIDILSDFKVRTGFQFFFFSSLRKKRNFRLSDRNFRHSK